MSKRKTFPYRYVMHVYSDGSTAPWHTRNDHLYTARYGPIQTPLRECTETELADILAEQARLQGDTRP